MLLFHNLILVIKDLDRNGQKSLGFDIVDLVIRYADVLCQY
jgi:hypothetical protein